MSKFSKDESKEALAYVDRKIDGAFLQMKIGAIIMIVCTVGLVATIAYAVIVQVLK